MKILQEVPHKAIHLLGNVGAVIEGDMLGKAVRSLIEQDLKQVNTLVTLYMKILTQKLMSMLQKLTYRSFVIFIHYFLSGCLHFLYTICVNVLGLQRPD